MAVAKMKFVNIIGHIDALDPVIFAFGATGETQPDDALTFFSDTSDFTSMREENPYAELLNTIEPAVTRVGGRLEPVEVSVTPDMNKSDLVDFVREFSSRASELSKTKSELILSAESISRDLEQFEHFRGIDINLDDILDCRMIKVRFGRLPKDSYDKLEVYDSNPYVMFFPSMCDSEYYWGVYFAPLEYAMEVDHVFSGLYFERLRIPSAVGKPDEIIDELRQRLDDVRLRLSQTDNEIREFWAQNGSKCCMKYAQLRQLSYFFSVRKYAARYNSEFVLTGWLPEHSQDALHKALDGIDGIEYTIETPDDSHHKPPVKLCNPGIFKPFEFFVNMYGLPRYNEIDPTAFISITYIILFGIMFGDVGQGLLVSAAGWFMWHKKKMDIGRILLPCGISSALFGVLFGSVFGFENLLDGAYKGLFGLKGKPIDVLKPSTTPIILLCAAGIGLLLIVISMLLNIYSGFKRKDFEDGIFGPNGVAGLVFYVSLAGGLISAFLGKSVINLTYVICLIILPLLLMFLREPLGSLAHGDKHWKPEKWGEFCVQNFFELFEMMLGYLSNTMSFLRVGAFVLVHAGMMMAVFTLAELTGGVGYGIIVVFGNALVIVMEALLVAIQVMRLEFYEMFSRYYKGDGRPFRCLNGHSGDKFYSPADA